MSQLLLSYALLTTFNSVFFLFFTSLPYVAREVKMPDLDLAYSQTMFNVLQLIGTTFMGAVLNRLDYKLSLLLCFGSVGISSLILVNTTSAWGIIVAQMMGILMQCQQCVQIAIARLTKPGSERTNAFSRLGLCFGLGFMFTPILGHVATLVGGARAPVMAAALISFGTLPLILFFIHDLKQPATPTDGADVHEKNAPVKRLSGWQLLRADPSLRLLFLLKVLLTSPAFLLFSSLQIHLMDRFEASQTTSTLLRLNIGISIMFSNSVGVSLLRRRYTEKQLIHVGAFFCLICYAQFIYFEYLFQIWYMMFLLLFATTILGNSADSLISASADQEQQGLILGLSNAAISAVRTCSPTVAIWLMKAWGYGSLGLVGVGASCLGIAYLYASKSFTDDKCDEEAKDKEL